MQKTILPIFWDMVYSVLKATNVTSWESGSLSYVITNDIKIVAVGSQKWLPATAVSLVQTTKPAAKAQRSNQPLAEQLRAGFWIF